MIKYQNEILRGISQLQKNQIEECVKKMELAISSLNSIPTSVDIKVIATPANANGLSSNNSKEENNIAHYETIKPKNSVIDGDIHKDICQKEEKLWNRNIVGSLESYTYFYPLKEFQDILKIEENLLKYQNETYRGILPLPNNQIEECVRNMELVISSHSQKK